MCVTYLLPTDQDSTLAIQDIAMYPQLKDCILPDNMKFQQYLLSTQLETHPMHVDIIAHHPLVK